MAITHRTAPKITAHDSGCCQCKSQRLFCQPGAGRVAHPGRLALLHHHREKPREAETLACCEAPFTFLPWCQGWCEAAGSAKLPACQPGASYTRSSGFHRTLAFPWSKWFLIFVRKFSNSGMLPRRVLCSLLHLRMWVGVSCVGCSVFLGAHVFWQSKQKQMEK